LTHKEVVRLTYISWTPDAEKEEKIVRIPRISFDCPKMNKVDIISFDIEESSGNRLMTLLQISQVFIEVGWNTLDKVNRKRIIKPASQVNCVKSIEPKPEVYPYRPYK
jgi:hypothetical protein